MENITLFLWVNWIFFSLCIVVVVCVFCCCCLAVPHFSAIDIMALHRALTLFMFGLVLHFIQWLFTTFLKFKSNGFANKLWWSKWMQLSPIAPDTKFFVEFVFLVGTSAFLEHFVFPNIFINIHKLFCEQPNYNRFIARFFFRFTKASFTLKSSLWICNIDTQTCIHVPIVNWKSFPLFIAICFLLVFPMPYSLFWTIFQSVFFVVKIICNVILTYFSPTIRCFSSTKCGA